MYRLLCERERIGRQRRQSFIDPHAIVHKFKNFVSVKMLGSADEHRHNE